MRYIDNLIQIDRNEGCGGPRTCSPDDAHQVWLYQPQDRDAPPLYILLARETDGAFRIAVAALVGLDAQGPSFAYLCRHRLEPPRPPARTPAGEVLTFDAVAALAWAILWIDGPPAP